MYIHRSEGPPTIYTQSAISASRPAPGSPRYMGDRHLGQVGHGVGPTWTWISQPSVKVWVVVTCLTEVTTVSQTEVGRIQEKVRQRSTCVCALSVAQAVVCLGGVCLGGVGGVGIVGFTGAAVPVMGGVDDAMRVGSVVPCSGPWSDPWAATLSGNPSRLASVTCPGSAAGRAYRAAETANRSTESFMFGLGRGIGCLFLVRLGFEVVDQAPDGGSWKRRPFYRRSPPHMRRFLNLITTAGIHWVAVLALAGTRRCVASRSRHGGDPRV